MGRKPLFVMSLAIFALATLWCGLAGSIESFVAARAVCGLGAGGAMTLGSILTSDLVPIEYVYLLPLTFSPSGFLETIALVYMCVVDITNLLFFFCFQTSR